MLRNEAAAAGDKESLAVGLAGRINALSGHARHRESSQLTSELEAIVEALLQRGTKADIAEAQTMIERLSGVQTEPGFVLFDVALLRLRALLARAHGDRATYSHLVGRYSAMSMSFGFEGHMALAATMKDSS